MSIVEVGPDRTPLFVREHGSGFPLLFLHGGWGYEVYPFDAQMSALEERFRVLIPDRSGYGRSPRVSSFPVGFHRDAAREMLQLLDALEIDRAAIWDTRTARSAASGWASSSPPAAAALILEATHYDRRRPRSRRFFELMVEEPETFGKKVVEQLIADHGDPAWRDVLAIEGRAWLEILDTAEDPARDLFAGRLSEMSLPTLVLHGADDPRTEAGEIEALTARLAAAELALIRGAGHSPHTSDATAVNRVALPFLDRVLLPEPGTEATETRRHVGRTKERPGRGH